MISFLFWYNHEQAPCEIEWEITLLRFLLTAIWHSLVSQIQLHAVVGNGYMKQEPRPHPQKIDVS